MRRAHGLAAAKDIAASTPERPEPIWTGIAICGNDIHFFLDYRVTQYLNVFFSLVISVHRGEDMRPVAWTRMHSLNAVLIHFAWIVASVVLVTGCSLKPAYERPDAPIPNVYRNGDDSTRELPSHEDFFRDPIMGKLIDIALKNNRDLRISLLNVEKNRAQYRIQRADMFPSMQADGKVDSRLQPADTTADGNREVSRQYSVELGFSSFELDLFGRIRSLTERTLENYYSIEEEAKSARLTLTAEVAAMYLQLVSDRQLYDLSAATAANRRKNFELIRERARAGTASDLELNQARTLVDEAKGNLLNAAVTIDQDISSLELLLGTTIPDDLPEIRKLSEVVQFPDVPAGLPSALLERRPDILAAEHILKGANANIGAARANFFPRISLTGAFGWLSTDYVDLWDAAQKTWTFAPQVSLPIFSAGSNIARLRLSEVERDIALARYEKAVQNAFSEVGKALAQRRHIAARMETQESLLNATTRSLQHATTRYNEGISPYTDVLDAERTSFSAQQSLLSTRLTREINALSLYKSLGGGWHTE